MKISALIVTRGDQDLTPIFTSFPLTWEILVWDNGQQRLRITRRPGYEEVPVQDLAVYGRYAAIEYAHADLIYTQDDDCLVSDPQVLVDAWHRGDEVIEPLVVCNMPQEFRHEFYRQHALVGFGACFHRDAPTRAFTQFFKSLGGTLDYRETLETMRMAEDFGFHNSENFLRTCDIVFTALTPRILVDVPVENLPWATDETRLYRQPGHLEERQAMLDLVQAIM